MSIFDRLLNNTNNTNASRMYDELVKLDDLAAKQAKKETDKKPVMQPIQINEDGTKNIEQTLALQNATQPLTFADRLFGRTISADSQKVNPKTGETELQTISNYRPGALTDFNQGLNENFYNNFSINNLMPNQNKSLATRFGEGLGTVAKILATVGGDAYTAGTSGLDAAMSRQGYRTGDQLYRQALESQGVDTSKIKGYINGDLFKNYALNSYRNRNLDVKMHLGTLSDNTKRAQLINTMLNTGELDPEQATQLMNQYGIPITDLDTSNQTKLLPYRQTALENGVNLGMLNYFLKADKAAQEKAINDAVQAAIKNLGNNSNTDSQTVKVKAPNGKTGTIPIEQLEGALAAGYTRI